MSDPDQQISSRALTCPDGVTRLVALRNAVWDAFDDLGRTYAAPEDMIKFCWDIVSRSDTVEERETHFSGLLWYYTQYHTRRLQQQDGLLANDAWEH